MDEIIKELQEMQERVKKLYWAGLIKEADYLVMDEAFETVYKQNGYFLNSEDDF